MNTYDFKGKVAFVTGAASGIGEAAALALRAGGAQVATFDQRLPVIGEPAIQGDVSNSEQVADAVRQTRDQLGDIDIVVHSAGIGGPFQSALELSEDDWHRIMSVNADGTFYVCRHTGLLGRRQGGKPAPAGLCSLKGRDDRVSEIHRQRDRGIWRPRKRGHPGRYCDTSRDQSDAGDA
jgi:NAD(P)-dependent dehydrogenase (short-subunit alcohol dehydrogenase family)